MLDGEGGGRRGGGTSGCGFLCACCVVDRLPLSSHCPHPRQAFASEAMAIIGEALGLPHDRTALYRSTSDVLREPTLLNRLHRDPVSGHFLDYGLHSEDVGLGRRSYPVDGKMQVWKEFTPHLISPRLTSGPALVLMLDNRGVKTAEEPYFAS